MRPSTHFASTQTYMNDPNSTDRSHPRGHLVVGDPDGEVLAFIGSIFDHKGRPGLARDLPLPDDRMLGWRGETGNLEGGMFARSWIADDGTPGTNLGYVCTHPDHRGEGLGSAMVEAAVTLEEGADAQFIMMWARENLIGFYQALGFTVLGREDYSKLSVPKGSAQYGSAPLAEVRHGGFEALRRADQLRSLQRHMDTGGWNSTNPGFPWAGTLHAFWGGTPEVPTWYAVVAPGKVSVTVMEFAGPPEKFEEALLAVGRHYGLGRVRMNLTNDTLLDMIEAHAPKEAGPPFYRLFRSNGLSPDRAPETCWLDRI
jgi:GNAT superfamily N-acetyltransferase